jgi:hypothetical protein
MPRTHEHGSIPQHFDLANQYSRYKLSSNYAGANRSCLMWTCIPQCVWNAIPHNKSDLLIINLDYRHPPLNKVVNATDIDAHLAPPSLCPSKSRSRQIGRAF